MPTSDEKCSSARVTVISNTSATLTPAHDTASTLSLKRRPRHAGQTKRTSAKNCISTVSKPSPEHDSQRPPSTLKEKSDGDRPSAKASGCFAYSARTRSQALVYVAALPREVRPRGDWSTKTTDFTAASPSIPAHAPGSSSSKSPS